MPGFPPKFEENLGMTIGFTAIACANYLKGIPVFTRYPMYAVAMTAGYFGGMAVLQWQERTLKKKILYINDYVQRHPEDYEIYLQDRKFKDILDPWKPVRNN